MTDSCLRCGGILAHSFFLSFFLQCCLISLRVAVALRLFMLNFPATAFHQDEVCALTRPLQHLDSFFFFQLLCCRFNALLSMSSCTTQFQPSFSWQSHGFTFYSMTAKFPSPVVAKIPQIIKPPPPCFTVGVSCLCWCAVFGFCLRCCSALLPNICSLFCPK